MSKIYTEEQIKGYLAWHSKQGYVSHKKEDMDEYVSSLIPIELPTDEEIIIKAKSEPNNINISKEERIGYFAGAKWMRNKVIGGGK